MRALALCFLDISKQIDDLLAVGGDVAGALCKNLFLKVRFAIARHPLTVQSEEGGIES